MATPVVSPRKEIPFDDLAAIRLSATQNGRGQPRSVGVGADMIRRGWRSLPDPDQGILIAAALVVIPLILFLADLLIRAYSGQ